MSPHCLLLWNLFEGEIHIESTRRFGGPVSKSVELYVRGPGCDPRPGTKFSHVKRVVLIEVTSVSVSRQTAVNLQCPGLP